MTNHKQVNSDDFLRWRNLQMKKLTEQYSVEKIREIVKTHGSPVYALSIPVIKRQYSILKTLLPRVKHHFALKSMPHEDIAKTIRDMDGYFDLATNLEIDLVKKLGVDAARTIHSHPIKRSSDIGHALSYGTNTFVFDNIYEFEKHIKYRDKIKVLLRLSFPNKEARVDLSAKFGVLPENSFDLIRKATEMGYNIVGLSFHVGSQMSTPARHIEAITFAHEIFKKSKIEGMNMNVLDIGGGFPIEYTSSLMSIENFMAPISEVLNDLFSETEIISEPGRFISGPSMTLFTSVMGKATRNGNDYYYLDDGLYGSYSGKLFDHGDYLIISLKELEFPEIAKYKCVISGPTCDSIDVPYPHENMPKLSEGDILISPMMGAYSAAHATDFNFFPKTKIVVEN